jgi:hypothetical protein
MLNCRSLDNDIRLLETDYRVSCNTDEHFTFTVASYILICGFAAGMPCVLVVFMLRRIRDYGTGTDSDRFVARRVGDELKIDDAEAADAIRDVSTGREYSFLVNAYK